MNVAEVSNAFPILAAIALALTGHAAQSEPTVLTVEQEKTKAAKPGSDFKECANGCPVMIVIPAGKFIMGSPENESDRDANEGPPQLRPHDQPRTEQLAR